MFQTKVVERTQKKHFLFSNFFLKIAPFSAEKYGRAGRATDDKMTHACCMLNDCGYKHILGICNTYCFSMATVGYAVARLRHHATSRKFVGLIPDGVVGIFHRHNPSGCTMSLGLTQPLTEMSTRNISWRVNVASA